MSSLIAMWSEKMLDMISVFLHLLRFDLSPKMWSIMGMFHMHLRRWCIFLHLDGMFWRYQWDPSHLMYHLRLVILINFPFWRSVHWCQWTVSFLLLLCCCQFLLLCLLVFVLYFDVLLSWVHRYLQLSYLPLGLIPWSLCSVRPYLL